MTEDAFDIPAFLIIPQAERAAAWERNPPKPLAPMVARDVEIARAEEKRRKAYERIEALKAKKAQRVETAPEPVDLSKVRWDARRNRWVPLSSAELTQPCNAKRKKRVA